MYRIMVHVIMGCLFLVPQLASAQPKQGQAPAVKSEKKPAQNGGIDLDELGAKLKAAVAAGKLSEEEALEVFRKAASGAKATTTKKPTAADKSKLRELYELLQLVEQGKLSADDAMAKYKSLLSGRKPAGKAGAGGKPQTIEDLNKLQGALPTTSTGNEQEGPASTFIFGWAGNATHRFMDNSHQGKPRDIRGLSFRLDYREHDAIGRTWESVQIRIGHGDFSSIRYNASREFELLDEPATVFDRQWSFPALKGFPPLKPASWGGPQNSLSFQFDKPFRYNGKDAIYVEFRFQGGKADDGQPWKGEVPAGFEYFLDSMPEIGGWRMALEDTSAGRVYRGPVRVAAATSYTAGGQSVWTAASKGMPFIRWDVAPE